jgi:putative Mn2+ efflux pump MntP
MDGSFVSALLILALASNVDTLGVGMAYGLRNRSIPAAALWTIGVVGGVVAGTAVAGGTWLQQWIPLSVSGWIAGVILIAIGSYSWMTSRKRTAYYHALLEREWWFLALGLSANNLAMGLTGGLMGYHPVIFGVCIGLVSNGMLGLGAFLGKRLGSYVGQPWLLQAGGLLLIAIGVFQLF